MVFGEAERALGSEEQLYDLTAFIRELPESSAEVIRTVAVPGDHVTPETFCTELPNAVARLTPSAGGRGRCQRGCRFCPQCDPALALRCFGLGRRRPRRRRHQA